MRTLPPLDYELSILDKADRQYRDGEITDEAMQSTKIAFARYIHQKFDGAFSEEELNETLRKIKIKLRLKDELLNEIKIIIGFKGAGKGIYKELIQKQKNLSLSSEKENYPKSVKTLLFQYETALESGNFTMSDLFHRDRKLYDALRKWKGRGGDLDAIIPAGNEGKGPRLRDAGVDISKLDPNDPRDVAYIQMIKHRADARARNARWRAKKAKHDPS